MNYLPRVQISVPPDRDYVMTLTQTKIVYDQLLGDKYNKLTEVSVNLYRIIYTEIKNKTVKKSIGSEIRTFLFKA